MSSLIRKLTATGLIGLSLGMLPKISGAQTPPPPVNHDFDFWLGDWEVFDPRGAKVGTNSILPVAGGRGLYENWEGDPAAGGGNGKSLNAYNPAKRQWQQFWVGSGSGVLELAGGLVDHRMVLTGESKQPDGRTLANRIIWTPNTDGTVRQLWEQSADRGQTWSTAFDGLYKRKAK